MRENLLLSGLLVSLLAGWVACQGYVPPTCDLISPCKCRYPWGSGFDLSNSTVLNFTLPSSNGSVQIFYNPCPPPMGKNNTCPQNAALCTLSSDGKSKILGSYANVTFDKLPPPPVPANFTGKKPGAQQYVKYLYTDENNNTISTTVIMKCAYAAPAPTLDEDPNEPGRFILNSKGACFTKVELPVEEGLSAGATFLIIFFSLFAAYFFGGVAILKFVKGAQGVEMIPNYEFWTSLPSLVKDGFLFAISGCRGSPSYDRI